MQQDIDLIARSQAGDRDAFAELFERTKNLVFRTALLMLDDRLEAEDALQEVFILVYRALPSYDATRGAFTTWLYRITMRHCLNRGRRRRIQAQSLDALPVEPAGESAVEDDAALRQAVARLSEKQRAVVVLRFYWDLPYAEIADVLDIPLGTVKSRLDLALRTLRSALSDDVAADAYLRKWNGARS